MASSSSGPSGTAPPGDGGALYATLGVRPDATDDEIRRAYRQLASTYHPDKAADAALAADATTAFHRIQEAYEVLSDPNKRDIYDVYGLDGVRSGMEITVAGKTPEEARREWEAARDRRAKEEVDAAVNFRGHYVFRIDATALVSPYAPHLPRTPELKVVSMTSGMDVPIESARHWGPLASEADVAHLGGFVYVKDNAGGGSFIAGYKRVYADYTTLEAQAIVGLRTVLSLTSTVQLSPAAGARATASWSPGRGLGLQLVTTRQLGEATNGEFGWVVGPREEAGVSLALAHRPNEKTQLTGRLEVGPAPGITLRAARRVGEDVTLRGGVKIGTGGAEVDLGAARRISELTSAGLAVVTGWGKGIALRLRFSRGGHLFEFPVQLTAVVDPMTLVAAHVLPPLVLYVGSQWIVGPITAAIEARRAAEEGRKKAEESGEAARAAAAAAALMAPVSRRRAARETAANGLVIALALYGEEQAVKAAAPRRLAAARTRPQPPPLEPTDEEEREAVVDVTVALQYMVHGGKAVLHQGYSKAGLLGFRDPAPGATKLLEVFYLYQGRAYVARVSDTEGATLPGRGTALQGPEEAAAVVAAAETAWVPPQAPPSEEETPEEAPHAEEATD